MTTIELVANDQLLQVIVNPTISSGEQNTVKVHVDFSEDWDGFAKSAVFFTANDTNTIYEKVMINGECIVPAEVMVERGVLYIGVRGVNSENNEIKTTSLVTYKISKGAPAGTGTEVEPTADVYQQLLTAIDHGIVILKETNKGSSLKFWVGTQAEYDALETKPENTFCIISDDTTKDFLLQAVEGLEKRTQSMFETLTLVSQKVGKMGNVLWSGSLAMGATDFIDFGSLNNLKNQPSGIMLVFSPLLYVDGVQYNSGYTTVCVPSALIPDSGYKTFPCFMTYGNLDHIGIKSLQISKNQIAGIPDNTGTRTSASGIKYDNDYFVLRYVIGY